MTTETPSSRRRVDPHHVPDSRLSPPLQDSIWSDSGNFVHRAGSNDHHHHHHHHHHHDDADTNNDNNTNNKITSTSTNINNDDNDNCHRIPPNIPPLQHSQHPHWSVSTYDYLYGQWNEAIRDLSYQPTKDDTTLSSSSSNDYFDTWFQTIWQQHTSYTTRFYHTVVHLEEMCFHLQLLILSSSSSSSFDLTSHSHADQADTKTTDDDSSRSSSSSSRKVHASIQSLLLLAIFFHDSIYDAHSSTNEEDSAVWFASSFCPRTNLHPLSVQLVVDWILATKHHHHDTTTTTTTRMIPVMDHHATTHHLDPLPLFLDLDLAVLGKTCRAYHQYARLIRQEYSFVPASVYCTKRADILTDFVSHPRIYQTDLFHEAFEERARSNIQQEIQLLRQGIIPS